MVSLPGRSGRRRRVLNEEVLSASSSHVALRAAADNLAVSASRYGEAAAVENHPPITDFIPRRHRTIAVILLGGIFVSVLAVAGQQLATQFVGRLVGVAVEPLNVSAQFGIPAWLSAVLLLATGVGCLIVHSIRQHRIDDVRGRYRVWRWAAFVCLFASANSVAGIHALATEGLAQLSGWTALRGGAIWWIGLAAIPLTCVIARTLLDVKESPFVAALYITTIGAYSVALVSFLGFLPAVEATWEPLVTCSATLVGHWLLLATIVSYARHVVLDAQGLIAVKQKARRTAKQTAKDEERSSLAKESNLSTKVEPSRTTPNLQIHNPGATREKSPPQVVPAKTQASMKDWVDGRRRERDHYQSDDDDDEADDDDRKLSKAERKQLRKLKARNRAA